MKKTLLTISAVALSCCVAMAGGDAPLWLRKNAVSPDGSSIAFAWQGDIYVVPSTGGLARQITTNPAYESDPLWSADGKSVIFSSLREGSKDIYMTSAEGGAPVRITDHPGSETPLAVLKDGTILFSGNIHTDPLYNGFPGSAQVYKVDPKVGLPLPVTPLTMPSLSVNSDGTVIYEDYKGYEDALRKHHTSSVTRDIWMYTPAATDGSFGISADGTFKKISDFNGEDRNPVFAADGKTFYYLSERGGTFNIYRSSIDNPGESVAVTSFDTHPVRYISVAQNGLISFSYDGELYTVKDGGKPQKVAVSIAKDPVEKAVSYTSVSLGITAMAPSPNGKEVAIVARGEVFVTSIDNSTTKRITNTPEQERHVSFSKDGRTLYYSAERDGHWGIYSSTLTNKEDKYFAYAYEFEEKLVTDPAQTCFDPKVSPDGEWLGFLRDRTELVVKNIKSGKETSLHKGVNYSYRDDDQSYCWAPDSKHILCNWMADGGWNNVDVALVDIETGKIVNLTESGYSDGNFNWGMGGKAMTWNSDKAGYRSHGSWGSQDDIYIMFFDDKALAEYSLKGEDLEVWKLLNEDDKKAKKEEEKKEKKDSTKTDEKKIKKLELELEGRNDRIVRVTGSSGNMGASWLNSDGTFLYFVSGGELRKMDTKKGDVKVLSSGVSGNMTISQDGKYAFFATRLGVTRFDLGSGAKKSISFKGEYDYKPAQEREYIFEHCWKQVNEKFYDPEIHGIDWAMYREAYRKFLPHIDNNYDFQELLSEMLGELNGSHTGARYRSLTGLTIGRLGLIYDYTYTGDGLKIAEVLKRGPVALADPEIKAGDIITAIENVEIKAGDNWYPLLRSKDSKRIRITVRKGGKKPVDLLVKPVSSESTMLYKRWIDRNEEIVEKLSGGRVGYVHVKGMDSESFREVYSKILGKYRSYEAVIVDTRHNGGGWLHDDLVTLLSGKEYLHFSPRGQYVGPEPFNRWNKPSCVVVGEDNYSDASGFPYAYRTLGIGKLIGAPVPGTMTAVWWENQIDPTIVFGIPQVGVYALKEQRYLENMQLEPDILVYNDPASTLRGEDKQLEAAVAEMLRQIGEKK